MLQQKNPRCPERFVALLAVLLLVSLPARAQTNPRPAASTPANPEQGASEALEKARGNPLTLRAFLVKMPKGADLHNHLIGAVYAESWIRAGAEDQLCVDLAALAFVPAPGPATASSAPPLSCGDGKALAGQAYKDQRLYDALIDSLSMRGFVPSPGVTGHDHFFAAFSKFAAAATDRRHYGEWLDEVASRAAAQNEQYVELMLTVNSNLTPTIAQKVGWNDDLGQLRLNLLQEGLRDEVAASRARLDRWEATRRQRENCGREGEAPACRVEIRYIGEIGRSAPKEVVFARALTAFETASADPRVVGINFVAPEDGYTSMSDYPLHMRMVDFLRGLYPKVHVSLHAGELAPGLVAPDGLCCHIRLAVEQAHAERIGHGVDVMYEERPYDLLREMAAQHVLVEINLTSNDIILGVKGKGHPFELYRKYGVPVALSTDDEGVSRIDIANEYVRATESYALGYPDLKQLVRASLEHSFLPGQSLWRQQDAFTRTIAACGQDKPGSEKTSPGCAAFLKSNERARQQWELERRFREFESGY